MFKKEDISKYQPQQHVINNIYCATDDSDKVNSCIDQIKSTGIDITNGYSNWLKIGFSLANLGETGRIPFHHASRNNPQYSSLDCDKQFNKCLKNLSEDKTSISTFFHLCKEHGITYKSIHNVQGRLHCPNGQSKPESPINKGDSLNIEGEIVDSSNQVTRIRTANERLSTAKTLPIMTPLFGTLWQTEEITILAADTGVGKTLLAVGVADAVTKQENKFLDQQISHNEKVLYYDFELTDRNFLNRYSDYKFSDNLLFVDYNPTYIGNDVFNINQIRQDILSHDSNVIIIDNISAISMRSTAEADESLKIMKGLKQLQLEFGLSILVLAHTPKIPNSIPLGLNHLAGSKHLSNFCDSVFFLGRSKVDPNYRYIIQKKSRNAPELEECIILEKVDKNGMVGFEFVNYDTENNHLFEKRSPEEEFDLIKSLHKQKKSCREIAKELGISKSKVNNITKKLPKS